MFPIRSLLIPYYVCKPGLGDHWRVKALSGTNRWGGIKSLVWQKLLLSSDQLLMVPEIQLTSSFRYKSLLQIGIVILHSNCLAGILNQQHYHWSISVFPYWHLDTLIDGSCVISSTWKVKKVLSNTIGFLQLEAYYLCIHAGSQRPIGV